MKPRPRRHLNLNGRAEQEEHTSPFLDEFDAIEDEGDEPDEPTEEFSIVDKPTSFRETGADQNDSNSPSDLSVQSSRSEPTPRHRAPVVIDDDDQPTSNPSREQNAPGPEPLVLDQDEPATKTGSNNEAKTVPMTLAAGLGGLALLAIGGLLFAVGHGNSSNQNAGATTPAVVTQTVNGTTPPPVTTTATVTTTAPPVTTTATSTSVSTAPAPDASTVTETSTVTAPAPDARTVTITAPAPAPSTVTVTETAPAASPAN